MGTIHTNINVSIVNGMVTPDPMKAEIPDVGTGDTVTIMWTPQGLTIDGIRWDPNAVNPPATPSPGTNGTFTTSFTAPDEVLSWAYQITVGGHPSADPEVDNVHP